MPKDPPTKQSVRHPGFVNPSAVGGGIEPTGRGNSLAEMVVRGTEPMSPRDHAHPNSPGVALAMQELHGYVSKGDYEGMARALRNFMKLEASRGK